MTRTDVIVCVFRPGTPEFDPAVADPAGFLAREKDALGRHAARRLDSQHLFPTSRGSWGVILPDADPLVVFPTIEGAYGREMAATLAQAVAQFPDAVIVWNVCDVVPKGYDSPAVRDR